MSSIRSTQSADPSLFSGRSKLAAPREFRLTGNSVSCACPDCGGPMSIRLWLLYADCWQCGASIELSDSQESAIHSLLKNAAASSSVVRPDSLSHPTEATATTPHTPNRAIPSDVDESSRRHATELRFTDRSEPFALLRRVRAWTNQLPAWLVSMLLHMAALALLALFFFEHQAEDPYIRLSSEANRYRQSGGETNRQNPVDEVRFDLPVPELNQPRTSRQRRELIQADQQAKLIRIDSNEPVPELPDLNQVLSSVRSSDPQARFLAARDPRIRVEMVQREGGTTLTEAAVARGLQWMADHQFDDGHWSLHHFSNSPDCQDRCRGEGSIRSDSAATSLCLLPFLGAGQTHQVGRYSDHVSRGLRWLLERQAADGDLRIDSQSNAGMYAHGQGTIVLCEAYAMSRDEQLRDPAQRAIDFIVKAQDIGGGWRYRPQQLGDTSVLGWQIMALQSGRAAGLDVPMETLELAQHFLDSVQYDGRSRYAYQPGREPTHTMTAEAMLCRLYLGWDRATPGLEESIRYLWKEHPPGNQPEYYYWYYATQLMHHFGGSAWKQWNLKLRDILVDQQQRQGHQAGSWEPLGPHASQGGRLYVTALAICTLEVYYRHAPIFQQIDLSLSRQEPSW